MAGRAGRKGNGEGNIRLRGDGRWEARLILPGGRSKSIFAKTRQDAARRLAAAIRDRDHGLLVALDERQTVATYLQSWLAMLQPTWKPRTYERAELDVRAYLIPALGKIRLARLTPQHVQSLYAAKLNDGLAPGTVHHLHVTLHHALNDAARLALVPRNVCELVTAPRKKRAQEIQVLTAEQAQQLLAAVHGDRMEALFVTALTTGMRQGELLALRWRGIDLGAGGVHGQHTMQYRHGAQRQPGTADWQLATPKTERSRREVELNPSTIEVLRAQRTAQLEARLAAGPTRQDFGFVFTRPNGEPLRANYVLTCFRRLLARAELPPIRFHDLRHTAATLMLADNVNAKAVQERLGHNDIGTTLNLYAHAWPGMQREAARSMERLFHRDDLTSKQKPS